MMQNPKQRREKKKQKKKKNRENQKKNKRQTKISNKKQKKKIFSHFSHKKSKRNFLLSRNLLLNTLFSKKKKKRSRERETRERETKRGVLLPYHRLSFSVSRRSLCILKEFSWGEIFVVSVYILDNKEK